ncbi:MULTISPECIES: imidazole glycerol phosphate synthase subunit HisH [Pseudomonas]|uniref:imidazole glycerol phosphate synthase subunit HisH n=1 Tax=Pseudomonas TaxID=286 RepID=UPI0006B50F5B|nr:imidazole glycerol phosphate synthase subunit HisH [Pseudomonas fuscovaginae]KPA96671.1 imidazole glycerol phosphate synthase, glutamine amidotransferase subunit [Pseudomonas fuscovaginae]
MSQQIGVVDYGAAGNVFSISRALEYAGAKIKVVKRPQDILGVDKLVMPGVGSFVDGMRELNASGMSEAVLEYAATKRPLLGICLGMQVLSKVGFEYGETAGLGLILGEVRPVQCKGVVPHMGFNTLSLVKESPLLKGVSATDLFYFMHSYEMQNYTDIIALTSYAEHQIVSAVQHDSIFGLQFHPEKSRQAGIRIFENFLAL